MRRWFDLEQRKEDTLLEGFVGAPVATGGLQRRRRVTVSQTVLVAFQKFALLAQLAHQAHHEARHTQRRRVVRLTEVMRQDAGAESALPTAWWSSWADELLEECRLAAAGTADHERPARLGRRPLVEAVGQLAERPFPAVEATPRGRLL